MPNYRKSLNLRYGVQVDDDNFIVNSNGAVGIGTSIPTADLDVRGTTKVVGLVTSNTFYSGVATAGILSVTQNANITGNVTANTFYGSAAGLTGIYAIAVDGWYVSSGTISTTSNVGIGEMEPEYQLQIGGNPLVTSGIGADSLGNIFISGIATIGNVRVSGLTTTRELGVTGVATVGRLSVSGLTTTRELEVTGVATVGVLTVTNNTTTNTLTVSSTGTIPILTIGNSLNAKDGIFSGTVKITTALQINGITTTNNLVVTGVGTLERVSVSGLTTTRELEVIGIATIPRLNVTGITSTNNLTVSGLATISSLRVSNDVTTDDLYSTSSVGIGTTIILTNTSLQIHKPITSGILVRSDTAESVISIGRSNSLTDFNGAIRFGNTNALFTYSDSQSIDIINYNRGNVNFYLNAGTTGIYTGSFHWHKGTNSRLMSLTRDGNLGIGITNPIHKLHVVGISTFTNSAFFNNSVTVDNNLTVRNNLTIQEGDLNLTSGTFVAPSVKADIRSPNGTLLIDTGTGSGSNALSYMNFNVTTGVSTASTLKSYVLGVNSPLGIIGENEDPGIVLCINNKVLGDGDLPGSEIVFDDEGNVGIGTTRAVSGLDLRYLSSDVTKRFVILPLVTTTQRNSLVAVEGSLIYNKSVDKLQFYNGSSWVGIATTSA